MDSPRNQQSSDQDGETLVTNPVIRVTPPSPSVSSTSSTSMTLEALVLSALRVMSFNMAVSQRLRAQQESKEERRVEVEQKQETQELKPNDQSSIHIIRHNT